MNDDTLAMYLCVGDRLAVRRFVNKYTDCTKSSRKRSLFEKLRRKMKLQRCDTDSEDDDAGRRPSATSKNAINKNEKD